MDRWSRGLRAFAGLALTFALLAPCAVADELIGYADSPCGEDALAITSELVICDSGGEGATSCETKWTVNMGGWGWPTGCGISCVTGHHACCEDPTWYRNARCSCVADPPRPIPEPSGPETPGL
jgi:hypothetical protein